MKRYEVEEFVLEYVIPGVFVLCMLVATWFLALAIREIVR